MARGKRPEGAKRAAQQVPTRSNRAIRLRLQTLQRVDGEQIRPTDEKLEIFVDFHGKYDAIQIKIHIYNEETLFTHTLFETNVENISLRISQLSKNQFVCGRNVEKIKIIYYFEYFSKKIVELVVKECILHFLHACVRVLRYNCRIVCSAHTDMDNRTVQMREGRERAAQRKEEAARIHSRALVNYRQVGSIGWPTQMFTQMPLR